MSNNPNPLLKKLGLANTDRVAIIHTDDIGVCQSNVEAFTELWEAGIISSGAIMYPCSWSNAAIEMCQKDPTKDMGVHLTLTSEWKNYRWGPISTRDRRSGLMDEEGYFYHTSEGVQKHGRPGAVKVELEAQINRALSAGLKPTHIDTHMGSVACVKFMNSYIQLAKKHKLPPMIFRMDEAEWRTNGLDALTAKLAARLMLQLEEQNIPLLDHLVGMPLEWTEDYLELTKKTLSELKPGITHFIIHPNKDTPELRAISPDWRARVANFEIFKSDEIRKHIQEIGLHIIGYRSLADLM
ncbi:MAG: polysaccharide deacetylase family protein [Anaerolineaceae bacterium]